MVINTKQFSVFSRLERKSASTPLRFGNQATAVGKALLTSHVKDAPIRGIHFAEKLQDLFKPFRRDVRKHGLSLEDVAGRLQTLIGIYMLQGYFAIKDDKHPWETNGRNAIVWVMTFMLQWLAKSDNWGINTKLLNPFMKAKGHESTSFKPLQQFLDKFRMDVDYLDILQDAGVPMKVEEELKAAQDGKRALWASAWLDANKTALVQNRFKQLGEKIKNNEVLTLEERRIHQAIPGFFKRLNAWNGVSTAVVVGSTIYLIGGLAMDIVNRVFSPLDKDFDGGHNEGGNGIKAKPRITSHPTKPVENAQPSPTYPPSNASPLLTEKYPVTYPSYASYPAPFSPSFPPNTPSLIKNPFPIQFLSSVSNPLRITPPVLPSGGYQS